MLSMVRGYRRSTRWQILSAREKSPETGDILDVLASTPPHLALHEFDDEHFDRENIKKPAQTEWSRRIVGGYQVFERDNWKLMYESGPPDSRLGVEPS